MQGRTGGVALVVHENHAKVAGGVFGLHYDRPVHVSMAPRLEHQESPDVIQMFAHVRALL